MIWGKCDRTGCWSKWFSGVPGCMTIKPITLSFFLSVFWISVSVYMLVCISFSLYAFLYYVPSIFMRLSLYVSMSVCFYAWKSFFATNKHCWKCNYPMNPNVHLFNGSSVCHTLSQRRMFAAMCLLLPTTLSISISFYLYLYIWPSIYLFYPAWYVHLSIYLSIDL